MTKMSLFKGDFTTPGFSNQKKGIFHDQNLDVHIFFSIHGVKTILTGS